MRKSIGLILVLAMTAALLAGCGQTTDGTGGSDTMPPEGDPSQPENQTPEADGGGAGGEQEDSTSEEGPSEELPEENADTEVPVVYMTTDINRRG